MTSDKMFGSFGTFHFETRVRIRICIRICIPKAKSLDPDPQNVRMRILNTAFWGA